ncbi:hypothetical protein Hanom_Chr01g00055781 [Helianthus anomalus]
MASRTRSHTADFVPTFKEQNLLKEPKKEVCSFDNADIVALKASDAFPAGAIIRPFEREIRSDVSSDEWVCFLAYPFSIGHRYPFPAFISRFFELTGLSYIQTMPMVWRVLVTLDQIKSCHIPDLCIEDLPIAYRLWSHELAPPSAESEQRFKEIYRLPESERTFSLSFASSSQKSSPDMFAPVKTPEVSDLEELDSYSGPVQVIKEPSPKPATSSKPVSSKATAVPKPSTATKPRGSSSRKRKESDSPATSEVFPYENHGFLESSRFMTCFLNQGLERLMCLCEDSCGLNKMLLAKLKKVETAIVDQGAITAAKSQISSFGPFTMYQDGCPLCINAQHT